MLYFYSSRGIKENIVENKYMTASQTAKRWNISQRRVQILCSQGRIDGVFKLGDNWAIPITAEKPEDERKSICKGEHHD